MTQASSNATAQRKALLTQADLARLAREASPEIRAELVGKIASQYSEGEFNEREAGIAVEIFRLLLKDVQERVREELSRKLSRSLSVPHDIAFRLAYDTESVAMPMLENSYVLTEEDLIDIAKSTREVAKLSAIARRDTLSMPLSGALIESEVPQVMQVVFNNRGALISEGHIMKAWEFISTDESLLEALVHRGGLSVDVVEKMIPLVSEELRSSLVKTYHLPEMVVDDAIDSAREWTTIGLMSAEFEEKQFSEKDINRLVDHLHEEGHLTPSIIMRSLCVGDLNFFEAAMAKLAGVPRLNARILLFDTGDHGFDSFYKATQMPESFRDPLKVLLKISLEETGYARYRRSDFRKRVLERVYAEGYHKTMEGMEYVLSIIGGKISAQPAE